MAISKHTGSQSTASSANNFLALDNGLATRFAFYTNFLHEREMGLHKRAGWITMRRKVAIAMPVFAAAESANQERFTKSRNGEASNSSYIFTKNWKSVSTDFRSEIFAGSTPRWQEIIFYIGLQNSNKSP
ncbi:MAG: hypothetical protein HY231_17540 [Acidobacteria bacterium]|nr:hypothetical protein [Acidobacteriota bacterium]